MTDTLAVEAPAVPDVDEVGRVLLAAADYIETYGWCQGAYEFSGGSVCAIGALRKFGTWDESGWYVGERRLQDFLGDHWDVASWNDDPGRTQAEVVEALRRAALGEGA